MISRSIKIIALVLAVIFIHGCKDDENLPPLKVFSIEPTTARYGDTVRIIGQGFSPGYTYNNVSFENGIVTDALAGSNSEMLLIEVPDGVSSGAMIVDILQREYAETPFIDILLPVVREVTPAEAWIGDTLTIKGDNFHLTNTRNHVLTARSNATTVKATRTELKVIVPQSAESGVVSVMGVEGPSLEVKNSELLYIKPAKGVVGDTIEIYGRGMNALRVNFINASVQAALLGNESNSRKLRVIVPPGSIDGKLKIDNQVGNGNLVLETSEVFEVYPSINSMSPLSGFPGTLVTLAGYNFSDVNAENEVSFNGTAAVVSKSSATEIVVIAPEGFTTGKIKVVVNGREAFSEVFAVAEPGAPVISSMTPRSGPVGSQVLIAGINFGTTPSSNIVKFSGNVTANVVSASATQVVVEVPVGATSGSITLTKDNKVAVAPSFTVTNEATPFISSITPSSAPVGGTITINGGNFVNGVSVEINGSSFIITSLTSTQIVAKLPNTLTLGDQEIYIRSGIKISNRLPFEVTGTPAITSIDITEGVPGAIVAINGVNFNPEEQKNIVKFGTQTANWTNVNDLDWNTVRVYVPDVPAGNYDLSVTSFGNASNTVSFTVKPKQVAVRNIVYMENALPRITVKRRTNDPPSETTIYNRPFASIPYTVVAIDVNRKVAFFPDLEGYVIKRANFDQTGDEVVYDLGAIGLGSLTDLTLDEANQKIYFTDIMGAVYKGDYTGATPPETLYSLADDNIVPIGLSYEPEDNSLYFISSYPGFAIPAVLKGATDGSGFTELFTESDGMVFPIDVKVDAAADKLFILDSYRVIKVGNQDGSGTLNTLITRERDIQGIALDKKDKFVYWMEFVDDTQRKSSVFRMKYDGSGAIEEVYTNIAQYPNNGDPLYNMMAAFALEDETGSGATRSGKK